MTTPGTLGLPIGIPQTTRDTRIILESPRGPPRRAPPLSRSRVSTDEMSGSLVGPEIGRINDRMENMSMYVK